MEQAPPKVGPQPSLEKAQGEKEARAKKKASAKASAKGIETMFRAAYRVHVELSNMADNKAGLLTTLNTLLLGLSGPLLGLIDTEGLLLIPLAIIVVSSALSLVLSVLAARPRITKEPIKLDQLVATKSNLLFFGNFIRLKPEEFIQGMNDIIEQPDLAYPQMCRDLHALGLVLQRKFSLLRNAYTVLMIGIPLGAILYVILTGVLTFSSS